MPENKKICPFMSDLKNHVACRSDCQLYRANRNGFECPLQELQSISWNTRKAPQGGGSAPPSGY